VLVTYRLLLLVSPGSGFVEAGRNPENKRGAGRRTGARVKVLFERPDYGFINRQKAFGPGGTELAGTAPNRLVPVWSVRT
jgi:hypothetical protein